MDSSAESSYGLVIRSLAPHHQTATDARIDVFGHRGEFPDKYSILSTTFSRLDAAVIAAWMYSTTPRPRPLSPQIRPIPAFRLVVFQDGNRYAVAEILLSLLPSGSPKYGLVKCVSVRRDFRGKGFGSLLFKEVSIETNLWIQMSLFST